MRRLASGVLVFGLVAMLAAPGLAEETHPQQLLNYLEQVRADSGVPGVGAAVLLDGEIVFSGGVGFAELENRTPQTGQTVNNFGSISKVIATVGLMQLVQAGKVDLDEPIQTYLPYYPEKRWMITLRHILTQTSGTRHYNGEEFGPHGTGSMRRYDAFEEATKLWRDDPLLFEPGKAWKYSSHAFNLLHGVIGEVSGRGFEDYLKEHVFEPAGMLATQFDVPSRIIHHRGRGHQRDDHGRLIHANYEDPSYKYAGGGMVGTVEDLVRFADAINRGALLRADTVEAMLEPQLSEEMNQAIGFEQALGWRIGTLRGHRYSYHGGSVKGVKTFLANFSEAGLIVAVQGNERSFNPNPVGLAIARVVLGASMN